MTSELPYLTGSARVAGVMGWPIAHSRSPRLHGYWLRRYGIDGTYVPCAVRPGDIEAALRSLPCLGFRGCNLTIPHKEAALDIVDACVPEATRIGAVNTVVVDPDRGLVGSNTDAFGFIENLRQGCPGWDAAAGPAVMIGAGGAARAIVVALLDAGVAEIRIANRTPERAERLAAAFGLQLTTVPWALRHEALDDAVLLVNATSLGMEGQAPLEIRLDALPHAAVVTDIVYAPLETDLLREAHARGHEVVDGLGMLLHQARPGFEAWFGVDPEVDDGLRSHVLGNR